MSKRRLVFETQKKRFYEGPDPGSLVENLRDSSDSETILNGRISEYFMQGLMHIGVPTHFIRRLNMRETLIEHSEVLPFSVMIRNRADKDYALSIDIDAGAILPAPIFEFHYHNAQGGKRLLSPTDLVNFELASSKEVQNIQHLALRVNDYLSGAYWSIGLFLVDIVLEFGRQERDGFDTWLMLADDIGPLQSQLWDVNIQDESQIERVALSNVAERLGFA